MTPMAARRAHPAVILALALAGCGSPRSTPLPQACADQRAIAGALQRAPAAVRLPGGTRLSRCVQIAARNDGDLQTLGPVLTRSADGLRAQAASDPAAALRLGYLVGAVRRGAAGTPGVAAQLARRVEQLAALGATGPRSQSALQRGIRAGEASG